MKKTAAKIEEEVMMRILSGEAYSDISRDTKVAVSTIKKIKKRNYSKFWQEDLLEEKSVYHLMRENLMLTYNAINKRLDEDGDSLTVRELLAIYETMRTQTAIKVPPYWNL